MGPRGRSGFRPLEPGKEVQQRAGRKGLDVEWSKRLYGNGRSCEQLPALSNALPPPRWLCHPRRTKPGLSSPCSWNAQTLRPVIYQAAGELSSAALTTAPQSFPVSQRSLPGVPRVSKAPAGTREELGGATELESREGDSGPLSKGRHSCHQLSGHRGSVTPSRPWGREGGSCAEHCSSSPQEEPIKGTGQVPQLTAS